MLRGSSGFYAYAVYERPKDWPGFTLANTRLAFKLNKVWFNYMAMADDRQRKMPLPDDRSSNRSQTLAYPEAVLLTNPIEPEFKGEVDDKYQYAGEAKDIQVHGWICSNPPIGLWQIVPNNEFRSAGPTKQYLTSHVLLSTHYSGEELMAKFEDGEPWKKVLGPLFVYANSMENGSDSHQLWEDAKRQLNVEAKNWPYSFAVSDDFPSSDQRGSVDGSLLVYDRTDDKGHFTIENVRPGNYNLYGWVHGFIGDYRYNGSVSIKAGESIDLGDLVYDHPRNGPILWEIGIPDRSAAEFFVPDPNPKLVNKLYLTHDKYRQYGLWDRYTDLYPDEDLVYTINESNYQKDWFFAQVRINDRHEKPPLFTTGLIGYDNTIARHGIHGLYWLYNVSIPANKFSKGNNTIFLTQAWGLSPWRGILYDYIRLEVQAAITSTSEFRMMMPADAELEETLTEPSKLSLRQSSGGAFQESSPQGRVGSGR
ncbi:Rhamnogalacturonate lyase [Bienertia sinuspersici]